MSINTTNTINANAKFKQSGILSVSANDIDCHKIAKMMKDSGIHCSVTENWSVVPSRVNGTNKVERGCRLLINHIKPYSNDLEEKIWKPLKNEFKIKCAHLSIGNMFNGCIYNYFRNSNCPGNKTY